MTVGATVRLARLLELTKAEVAHAVELHGEFNSAHEGYAVILEELDELWEHVRLKRADRDPVAMRVECVQIAAAALKFAASFGGDP